MFQKDSELHATRHRPDAADVGTCRSDMTQAAVPRDSVFKVLRFPKTRSASLWRRLGQAVAVLSAGLCFHMPAFAACTVASGSAGGIATASLPGTVSVPLNAAVGTVLYDSGTVQTPALKIDCASGGYQTVGYMSARSLVPGYTDTYQTGVAGIGIKVQWGNWQSDSVPWTSSYVIVAGTPATSVAYPAASYGLGPMGRFRVQLVVTGPVGSGTLNLPTTLVQAKYDSLVVGQLNLTNGTASVQAQACKVTTPTIPVPMPTARLKDLPSVGSTTGTKSFSLDLNCNAGVALYVTLSDASTPSNSSKTLSLSSDSTAKGVGYQIAYSGSPAAFGTDSATAGNINQFSVSSGKTVGGPVSVPLTVNYVRTATISPGTANAKATFTMSYQ